jgi:hypothetical protein
MVLRKLPKASIVVVSPPCSEMALRRSVVSDSVAGSPVELESALDVQVTPLSALG